MARAGVLKEVEEFPRRIKIFILTILSLLIFGTLGFVILSGSTLHDASFRTLKTLAFMFADESTTLERYLEIFLALFGVFIVWWVLWSMADMILDGSMRRYIKTRYYAFKIGKMKDHVIVVGGGRVGGEIARVLASKGKDFIVIESDAKVASALKNRKYTVIEGDALDEATLKKAGIEEASKIIPSLPKTESNIMITLTAKELNPKIEVYARCEHASLMSKLRRAGAKEVIIPEVLAGDKIVDDLKL